MGPISPGSAEPGETGGENRRKERGWAAAYHQLKLVATNADRLKPVLPRHAS
jgi:hypothetical protein